MRPHRSRFWYSIVTCLPATIKARCLREANPYACFRSGASIPAKRILCCSIVGVEDVEGIAIGNLDDLAGKGIG